MIRDLRKVPVGIWFADYRYDEGIRVRESSETPTLCRSFRGVQEGLSNTVYVIEVTEIEDSTNVDGKG